MDSSDNGSGDCVPEDASSGMLERILRQHAEEHFNVALRSTEGLYGYYLFMLHSVANDFKSPHYIVKSSNDFLLDRFIFYRRHKELDKDMAMHEAYCDTFEYLVQLKNDLPPVSASMKDNFRD